MQIKYFRYDFDVIHVCVGEKMCGSYLSMHVWSINIMGAETQAFHGMCGWISGMSESETKAKNM